MSTMRRQLGTGPSTSEPDRPERAGPRLLPIERASLEEHQEHDEPRSRPAPGRRPLGDRGQ